MEDEEEALSEEAVQALRAAFTSFDEDGSGFVDFQELKSAFKLLGVAHVSEAQLHRRFAELDADGSGHIDFEEFTSLFLGLMRKDRISAEEARDILRKRVVDRGGQEVARLAAFLTASQPFFRQLHKDVVRNLCRYVTYDEVAAGELLMRQGERGDHMFALLAGRAAVYVDDAAAAEGLGAALARTKTLDASLGRSKSLVRMQSGGGASLPRGPSVAAQLMHQGSSSSLARQPSLAPQGTLLPQSSLALQGSLAPQASLRPQRSLAPQKSSIMAQRSLAAQQSLAGQRSLAPQKSLAFAPPPADLERQPSAASQMAADIARMQPLTADATGTVSMMAAASARPARSRSTLRRHVSMAPPPSEAAPQAGGSQLAPADSKGLPWFWEEAQGGGSAAATGAGGGQQDAPAWPPELGRQVAEVGAGDCVGERALLVQGGTRSASVLALTDLQVVVIHRAAFTNLLRPALAGPGAASDGGGGGGGLLYQVDYLTHLLDTPPAQRSETDVLKLLGYFQEMPRFAEVPRDRLVLLAQRARHEAHEAGAPVVRQGDASDSMYIILQGTCDVHVSALAAGEAPPADAASLTQQMAAKARDAGANVLEAMTSELKRRRKRASDGGAPAGPATILPPKSGRLLEKALAGGIAGKGAQPDEAGGGRAGARRGGVGGLGPAHALAERGAELRRAGAGGGRPRAAHGHRGGHAAHPPHPHRPRCVPPHAGGGPGAPDGGARGLLPAVRAVRRRAHAHAVAAALPVRAPHVAPRHRAHGGRPAAGRPVLHPLRQRARAAPRGGCGCQGQ